MVKMAMAKTSDKELSADGSRVSKEPRSYSIRAVERVCDILDLLRDSGSSVSLSEVARVTGLPTSSAFRYLTVLESRRYVERNTATGEYDLGLAFVPLQSRHIELLKEKAKPLLERLRDRFGETVNLGVLDGTRVVYVDILESPKAMRLAARLGDHDHLHSTALGKAIAAYLPGKRVREILSVEGMPRITSKTITNANEYLEELEKVKREGFALDDGENESEGRCLAVAILGYHVPAAISLSAPRAHFPIEQVGEVAESLREAAQELATELEARK
jgi:IclR family acetate operon transcriptional repressor